MIDTPKPTTNQLLADAASAFQQQWSGHTPQSVTVILNDETLVITLHGALSLAERVMAQSATGAARVREFHRQLFDSSNDALLREIARITGSLVHEAAAELDPASGNVVHAFTTGTMVQIFHLVKKIPLEPLPLSPILPA